jgi:predicted nucleic acid-binding protein
MIILDSTPLALLLQSSAYVAADQCRRWLLECLQRGSRIIVPEIIDYEVRRELIRLDKARAINALDAFIQAETDRYLPLKTPAIRLAAQLWARARQKGLPTADPHALDIDVLLAAQVLAEGWSHVVVATSNINHLQQFVPAELWMNVTWHPGQKVGGGGRSFRIAAASRPRAGPRRW